MKSIKGRLKYGTHLDITDTDTYQRDLGMPDRYNAQVNLLRRVLPDGAQVGTVDKFQGQEAELVLVSMTTSSGKDLPRNIEFLYSKNRLNVAISRAKCLSVVVANPQLFSVGCSTPLEVVLVNLLCWAGAVGRIA